MLTPCHYGSGAIAVDNKLCWTHHGIDEIALIIEMFVKSSLVHNIHLERDIIKHISLY